MNSLRIKPQLMARLGVIASVIFILLAGSFATYFVRSVIGGVDLQGALENSNRMREGFAALSDIQQMNLALYKQQANGAPEISGWQEFETSLDGLYVRAARFDLVLAQTNATKADISAANSLRELVELGDEIVAGDRAEFADLADQFRQSSETARQSLVAFIDGMRQTHIAALTGQSETFNMLQFSLQVTILVVSAIALSAILLLHRELWTRKQREEAEERAEYLAYNDPLTGLANRLQFNKHLAQLVVEKGAAAMIFLDLDDFKGINDTYGHGFGDVVLATVAGRMRDAVAKYGGEAARLGGDEFGALLNTDNRTKLTYLCNEILSVCAEPITDDGVTIQCGVSLGVATSAEVRKGYSLTAETMSRAADFALYDAKAAGRGTFRIYDRALDEQYLAHRDLIDAIPNAIENREFFVTYQPKVHLDGLEIYGFEALIRWRRDGKVISPGDFLPVAEEARQIIKLDRFVLGEATRQMAQWNVEFGAELSVSVNLSALHFEDTAIVDEVKFALASSGLDPHHLTLELTETVLLEDWSQVHDILSKLRGLGCKISLDDFGTGYSSLAYLRRIQADELKIDRSFVVDIESSQETAYILDALVDIAQSLGMTIVVEGIENEVQAQIVASYGCDLGQGYYFGAPAETGETQRKFLDPETSAEGFSLPLTGRAPVNTLQSQAQSA